jgi:hypothetical protein
MPTVPTPPALCDGIPIFDVLRVSTGDHCVRVGGTLTRDHWWTLTVRPLAPATTEDGQPELCSQVTWVNRTNEPGFMTSSWWFIETPVPPRGDVSNEQESIGGTLVDDAEPNWVGDPGPGRTATGTVCFDDVGHLGQTLVILEPPGYARD